MNNIIITTVKVEHSLDTTRHFAVLLSKALSIIHLLHWYITDYNIHVILGDLYNDLDDSFDKLQEEIIGTSQHYKAQFPGFSPDTFSIDDISQYSGGIDNLMEVYDKTTTKLCAVLNSQEFNNYISTVTSGLNNTKEDILSRINKANYLLSLIIR
jgi:hypothetical protein